MSANLSALHATPPLPNTKKVLRLHNGTPVLLRPCIFTRVKNRLMLHAATTLQGRPTQTSNTHGSAVVGLPCLTPHARAHYTHAATYTAHSTAAHKSIRQMLPHSAPLTKTSKVCRRQHVAYGAGFHCTLQHCASQHTTPWALSPWPLQPSALQTAGQPLPASQNPLTHTHPHLRRSGGAGVTWV
jgi:hypothetical protein